MNKGLAVVTGASSGIGFETAKKLAAIGYDLALIARREDRLNDLKKELEAKYKNRVHCFATDITDYKSLEGVLENPVFKDSTVLVNNAGLALGADPIDKMEFSAIETTIDTNLKSLIFVTQKLLPILKQKKLADIVNLGSIAGRWSYPGGSVYCATKFAVRAFSESLRMDLLGTGVRVSNIEPGMVETEFSEVRFNDKEKAKSVYKGMTPLVASDIADVIIWTLQRPDHVVIQEIVVYPRDQASPFHVNRNN
jgi:NADP-dependent 3-hydroxy acid dehydrogenase YdfG